MGTDPVAVLDWPIGLWVAALDTMDDEASQARMARARAGI